MNNNNRNNRRRGRGNRNQTGNGNQLNRIDSRARGNAPQMLDKYKKLAQDAQHNGDRVQMEYYLQFADHYFRVIADNKARQDEARGKRGDARSDRGDDSDSRDEDDDDGSNRRNDNHGENRSDSRKDKPKNQRRSRSRPDDSDRFDSDEDDSDGDDRSYSNAGNTADNDADDDDGFERQSAPKPRRRRVVAKEESRPASPVASSAARVRKPRAKKPAGDAGDKSGGEIDSAVLPPAIGG